MHISQSNINIYKSLFRGREDVYAVRWEKDGRSGYMPAYKVDWDDYNRHKSSGGTFANYTKKEYMSFNDGALKVSDRPTPSINIHSCFLSLHPKRRLWYIGH